MRHTDIQPLRKRHWAGIAIALLLALGVVTVFTASAGIPIPFGEGTGPWQNPVNSDECQGDQICAEWPSQADNTVTVCCVDPEVVGTYETTGGCQKLLGRRALN